MSGHLEAVLPYWLDRPDDEALQIAVEAQRAGLRTLWIGEMATFDAVALATAVGHRARGLRMKLGPMAIGVRSPVSMALAATSVASLTGSRVDIALGASSPAIVAGWHDREWRHAAARAEETIVCLRAVLAGQRSDHDGRHVRTHGFRLRSPRPDTRICLAAFGPAMTRVAARHADEVVMNLVPPERVRATRAVIEAEAAQIGRAPARLAVWVPVAVEPGEAALAQLASQLSVYLGAPGYGEMFSELGFDGLVRRAREGSRRSDLAQLVPPELLERVCALGSNEEVAARVSSYYEAGADIVGVAPSTAEDPAGHRALVSLAGSFRTEPRTEELRS